MHGLNVVGVIVAPGAAHATGTDVVGNDVAVIGELLFTDPANSILRNDLPVEELAHLPVGAQLAVSARMLGIIDAPDAHLALAASFLWDCLPATAGEGAVDWTELVSAESHGSSWLDGRSLLDERELGCILKDNSPHGESSMGTTTIDARCNARPTRLAFVLPVPDRAHLLNVITRTTTLWGGRFDPIVILDGTAQRVEGQHYAVGGREPYLTRQANLLREFDPDLLIAPTGTVLPPELQPWEHRAFSNESLMWDPLNSGQTRSFFVDVQPILRALWDKEFKNVADPVYKIRQMRKADSEANLLLAARFGLYERDAHYQFMADTFKAEELTEDWLRAQAQPTMFQTPMGVTTLHCRNNRPTLNPYAAFLLDPQDPFDVVDFWNLRAAGMVLLPLTMATYREDRNIIAAFSQSGTFSFGEARGLTIIKARSITDEQHVEVQHWIRDEHLVQGHVIIQGWVPEFGMHGYPAARELDIEPIEAFEGKATGVLIDGYGTLDGPKPSFLDHTDHNAHWSMDWNLSTFRTPEACYRLPRLNIGCDRLVARQFGFGSQMKASRVGPQGIVTRQSGINSDIHLSPITVVQAVKAFLEGAGIQYEETSEAGLALLRIIEMLGSLWECEIFQNAAVRQTLKDMSTGDPRTVHSVDIAVRMTLKDAMLRGRKMTEKEKAERSKRLLARAIDAKVFQIGFQFQCSTCHRHGWYAMSEFTDKYTCKICFAQEKTPHVHEMEWYFSSAGLFRNANNLNGNITVLLAFSFFQEIYHLDGAKYAPSFLYRIGGAEKEMDFAIVGSESFRPDVQMIFGEAKTGASLDDDERAKLRTFGLQTKSYICFCTLLDDFSDEDKEYFKELHRQGVKLIMLPGKLLLGDHEAISEFHSKNRGRSDNEADWLRRQTIVDTLGQDFAREQHLWV